MLDSTEHLFLFSKPAIRELFRRSGPPASNSSPQSSGFTTCPLLPAAVHSDRTDPEQRSAALCRTVEGRFIQALLDLDDRRLSLLAEVPGTSRAGAARDRMMAAPTPDNASRFSVKSADSTRHGWFRASNLLDAAENLAIHDFGKRASVGRALSRVG